jgi:hypothetical protein
LTAQQTTGGQDAPKTKLEAFVAQTGTVVVQGFAEIGTVRGQLGTSIAIVSKEFTNASTGKKEYGVTIQVKETLRLERDNTSYIDYDEIDSLLKGIDYIAKIDGSVTKLGNFQADYRTKGDFSVSTYSSGRTGSVEAAATSGRIGVTRTFLKLTDLQSLRDLVAKAKAAIDAARGGAEAASQR